MFDDLNVVTRLIGCDHGLLQGEQTIWIQPQTLGSLRQLCSLLGRDHTVLEDDRKKLFVVLLQGAEAEARDDLFWCETFGAFKTRTMGLVSHESLSAPFEDTNLVPPRDISQPTSPRLCNTGGPRFAIACSRQAARTSAHNRIRVSRTLPCSHRFEASRLAESPRAERVFREPK